MVPIGVSHISSWLQEIKSREWEERTKNKRTIWAWVNSSARRLSCDTLHSLCICRLSLAWISGEISTKLLGMPTHLDRSSLTALDSLTCRLVSSAVQCRLPTATLHLPRQLLLWVPSSISLSRSLTHFQSRLRSRAQAFVWFRAKTDKAIVCLADHPHSVTDVFYSPSRQGKFTTGNFWAR